MQPTPTAFFRPYYHHSLGFSPIPPPAPNPTLASPAAGLASGEAAMMSAPQMAHHYHMPPHYPPPEGPTYHYGRGRPGRRGPSRLVWFTLGIGAAAIYYHRKEHRTQCQERITATGEGGNKTIHEKEFNRWRYNDWHNDWHGRQPAASADLSGALNESNVVGKEVMQSKGVKDHKTSVVADAGFRREAEQVLTEKKDEAVLFISKRIDDLTSLLDRLKQSLEVSTIDKERDAEREKLRNAFRKV